MPLDFAISALLTLFVMVDPAGLVPTFLAVTEDLPRPARRSVAAACLVAFLFAERIGRFLGLTGNIVLSRLLGVLLAALAVQYVVDGVRATFAG